MLPLLLLPKLKMIGGALAAGLLLGSGFAWWATSNYKDASWQASVMKQEVDAANILREALERAVKAERENGIYSARLETQYHENMEKQQELGRRNQRLARERGGLRDPGRRASSQCPVSGENAGAQHPQEAAALATLSPPLERFLWSWADDGALLDEYTSTCYRYANDLPVDDAPANTLP